MITNRPTMEELYQGFKIEAGRYKVAIRRDPPPRLMTGVSEGIHPDRNMMRFLKPRQETKSHVLDSGNWGTLGRIEDYPCSEIALDEEEPCVLRMML